MPIRYSLLCLAILAMLATSPSCTAAFPQIDREAAWEKVHQELLSGDPGVVVVYLAGEPFAGGSEIGSWIESITVPSEFESAWFFFIDDAPDANWEHPCRYVFVEVETGAIGIISGSTPPDTLIDMERLYPEDE